MKRVMCSLWKQHNPEIDFLKTDHIYMNSLGVLKCSEAMSLGSTSLVLLLTINYLAILDQIADQSYIIQNDSNVYASRLQLSSMQYMLPDYKPI